MAAMSTPAERIIAEFGGLGKLAKALGHRHRTTVQGWRDRGVIPVRHAPQIIEAGSRAGKTITADDFMPAATRDTPTKGALA